MPLYKERAKELIQKAGVDAVLATSAANIYYISDYDSISMKLSPGLQSYALLPLDNDPALIAPLSEVDLVVESGSWIKDIHYFGSLNVNVSKNPKGSEVTNRIIDASKKEAGDTPCDVLAMVVTQRGLARMKIAIDLNQLSPLRWETIRKNLPDVKFVNGTELLNDLKAVKTPEEINRIQHATEITEKSMEDALEIAQPNIMELDLSGMFNYSVAEDGGKVTYDFIGFGERSAYPNPLPSSLQAQKGDLIRLTLGTTWNHYNGNVARTAVLGKASSEIEKRLAVIVDAQESAFDMIKPGAKISDVYAAAEKELLKGGVKQCANLLGHGIGIECNEYPWITKGMEYEIKGGMVLNIDIPYLDLGWGGIEMEDTVLVTKKGVKLMTNTERTIYLL